jgi:kynurenine formamidase
MNKIIDLTHYIEEDMAVYPGTEGPQINDICTIKSHGFREKLIKFYSHTGTHMDAPAHMIDHGKCLDDFEIDKFIGNALVIEITDCKIRKEVLKGYEDKLENVDFLLFKTGWHKKWGTESYFYDFPTLTLEAANYLTNFSLKGIGVDAISVDPVEESEFVVHNVLLNESMVLIENLNLDGTKNEDQFLLNVLPLKIKKADGSPIRAVALYKY